MTVRSLTALLASGFSSPEYPPKRSTAGSAASGSTLTAMASCSSEETLKKLGSSTAGLTTAEAEALLRTVGPNEVAHEAR